MMSRNVGTYICKKNGGYQMLAQFCSNEMDYYMNLPFQFEDTIVRWRTTIPKLVKIFLFLVVWLNTKMSYM